ncbi:hypothetical protein [Dactylosporangium salmoneum]|uniref:DUF222 domain-containing protein n=1 Tax=Dactylosporangium salmoneum TaxID=53361 RepID=A0ABP5V3R1_9ACTN
MPGDFGFAWLDRWAHRSALRHTMGAYDAQIRGAVELSDLMLLRDSVLMLIKRDARAGRPVAEWPETVAKLLAEARPGIEARREAELAEVSLFVTHPPSGLRAKVLAAQAGESAAVVASAAQNDRIDAELAAPSARSARTLKLL